MPTSPTPAIKKPYTYQIETAKELHHLPKALMALDLGLGKTLTSLLWTFMKKSFHDEQINEVVVVCQAIKINDWRDEILGMEFGPDCSIKIVNHKYGKPKHQIPHAAPFLRFTITTYQSLIKEARLYEVFTSTMDNDHTIVIFDESQFVKSTTSQIGKLAVQISKQVPYMLLLSGDPISNGYIDLYNQMKILGFQMTKRQFMLDFCEFSQYNKHGVFYQTIIKYKNIDALMKMLKERAIFLKTEDVLPHLPSQNFQYEQLIYPNYEQLLKRALKGDLGNIQLPNAVSVYSAMRYLASNFMAFKEQSLRNLSPTNPKWEFIWDLWNSSTDNFIIYYNFRLERQDLIDLCKQNNILYKRIDGDVNEYADLGLLDKRHFLLVQYQAGSIGINLQMYNRTIYYSPTNSGNLYRQSLARTHRLGQTKPCFYYLLEVKGSIESKMYKALAQGKDYSDKQFVNDYYGELVKMKHLQEELRTKWGMKNA